MYAIVLPFGSRSIAARQKPRWQFFGVKAVGLQAPSCGHSSALNQFSLADSNQVMYIPRMRTISLILIFAVASVAACSKQPVRETSAVVVNIAPGFRPKWDTDKVRITARTLDGLVTVKNVPLAQLKCHVSDTVRASVQGIALTLDDRACIG